MLIQSRLLDLRFYTAASQHVEVWGVSGHILILGPQEATACWSVSTCHPAPVAQSLLTCSVHQSALVPQGWQDLSHPLRTPAFLQHPPKLHPLHPIILLKEISPVASFIDAVF